MRKKKKPVWAFYGQRLRVGYLLAGLDLLPLEATSQLEFRLSFIWFIMSKTSY